ncbi:hypothetical protein K432DRAFT_353414 [Lepidopterella palustris CBS 459.81]|uniref:Uncharacterized protein n=1 Tax=Lepidopterella palustris CBS 459.81 TaxID=1314670 RepID=A0A8E2EA38_9PEZI|nr:hypothetical protein K432DRAFT_353414 [Lepidopterella palustris CBS 459.81]
MDAATDAPSVPTRRPHLGTADTIRARELHKYYDPTKILSASQSSQADTVLTAHVQLVSWRLNVQRSLISLIDREIQYFVAESTKTLNLEKSSEYDDPGDAIWAGCTSVPKQGRLCEHTLQTMPGLDGSPAYFEVLNLEQDPRFNQLSFVQGPPYFKYYCGVPIRTRKGVNIGSLFALDAVVKEPISETNIKFLTTMSENIMTHLEMMKEKEERKRAMNMNMCLAAFVDPEHQSRKRRRTSPLKESRKGPTRNSATDGAVPEALHNISGVDVELKSFTGESPKEASSLRVKPSPPRHPNGIPANVSYRSPIAGANHGTHRRKPTQENLTGGEETDYATSIHSTRTDSDTSSHERVNEDDVLNTFKRAAHLLYESLSLEKGGGVVFLDTMTSFRGERERESDDQTDRHVNENTRGDVHSRQGSSVGSISQSLRNGQFRGNERQPKEHGLLSGVLGASGSASSWGAKQGHRTEGFKPMAPTDLLKLVKRYPRGKHFTLDTEGFLGSSSSGDDQVAFNLHLSRKNFPSGSEASLLLKHFPGARQIIFLPLWDSILSRWSACFVYNTYEFHDITHNPDFLYCIAFCNCVMTEIGRLATLAADQQKSDFIGSISHELRSPLHGILASMEFLTDTECTSFQRSLIDTADSCARTLLDTINMVLDYSRLNAFERNSKKASRSARRGLPTSVTGTSLQPQLSIYSDVDLAAITEEVVEGVSTGQVFKDITTVEGADVPINPRNRVAAGGANQKSMMKDVTRDSSQIRKAEVEIIIDISARNWSFVTQPGAFRRIVMNLFGNSLKYTKRGYIKVKLDAKDAEKKTGANNSQNRDVSTYVTLTVTDTGQGISPEYMRNKLFTPFAQESSLNPGTGLGLSLVKGIVNMLNGEISIRSTLGVGTEVTVTLPMSTMSSRSSSSTTPSSAGSTIERVKDDSLTVIKQASQGRNVVLFWNEHNLHSSEEVEAAEFLRGTLTHYFTAWYGFSSVTDWSPTSDADVIAVDETDLALLLEALSSMDTRRRSQPIILVFCSNTSRLASADMTSDDCILEFVCLPAGPYKLARALRLGFETLKRQKSPDSIPEHRPPDSADSVDRVVTAMEEITLTTSDPEAPDITVLRQGEVLANKDSSNANMAMDTWQLTEKIASMEEKEEYPFPADRPSAAEDIEPHKSIAGTMLETAGIIDRSATRPSIFMTQSNNDSPKLEHRRTMSPTRPELCFHEPPPTASMTPAGAVTTTPEVALITPIPISTASRPPRLLLVDDNAVNLRLLQMFMKKRKYKTVSSAENGALAVSVFRDLITAVPPQPPDIIFMDISMPILDGFAATRQIREIESEVAASFGPMQTPPPSLIIALTGLASGKDQSEAFISGFDLYMTKPVSFREVGRLLDNWQANGGATKGGQVPHGSLTGREEVSGG